jgi:hypothetical protein
LHETAGCSARQRGPNNLNFRTPLPIVTSADLNIDRKCFNRFKLILLRGRPDASRPKPSFQFPFSFESAEGLRTAFHKFGADAPHISIITSPVQQLPFDNGPNRRIDNAILRHRVVAR